jgi:hypothetical protein
MADEAEITCLGCGQAMPLRVGLRVCSHACRQREWRARRRRQRRQFCACCGGIFAPSRADARFCSLSCRQKGHRQRKAGREIAPWRPTAPPWRVFEAPGPRHTGAAADAAPGASQRLASSARFDAKALIG